MAKLGTCDSSRHLCNIIERSKSVLKLCLYLPCYVLVSIELNCGV